MSKEISNTQLIELRKPMSLKWRVQRAMPKDNPTTVIMVGYIDARDIQDRLDDVVGMGNWQTKYYECKGKQFCEIGIRVGDEWVWKADSGTESQTEKQKGETSDAFKRAAVHWGMNRQAYQVGLVTLPCKMYMGKPYPCDNAGVFLKGKNLFAACNKFAKVDDMEVEFDNLYFTYSTESITLEDVKELLELKRNAIPPNILPNYERIINNQESDKYKYMFNQLKSL
jgi:hypothetical protein